MYQIQLSTDLQEIGVSGQIQEIFGTYDIPFSASFKAKPKDGPIEHPISFPKLKMERKAAPTDLIDCTPLGFDYFVVSSKMKQELLQSPDLVIDNCQFFQLEVYHRGVWLDNYWAVYLTYNRAAESIDWDNSVFSVVDKKGYYFENGVTNWMELERFSVSSYEEYINKARSIAEENNYSKMVRNNCLRYNETIEFDFFKIKGPVTGYFCSEKFKIKALSSNISGIDFAALLKNS